MDGRTYSPVGKWFIPLSSHSLQCFIGTNRYQLVQSLATMHMHDGIYIYLSIYIYILNMFEQKLASIHMFDGIYIYIHNHY